MYSYLKKPVKRNLIIKALDDISTTIDFTSQITSKPVAKPSEKKATSEQLARLEQLEKQIQELESKPSQKNFQQKLTYVPVEPTIDLSAFKTIIHDLKSLQAKFERAEQHMNKLNVEVNTEQKIIIKKELEKTLSEITELKKQIQLLDEMDDSKSQHDPIPLIYKKT